METPQYIPPPHDELQGWLSDPEAAELRRLAAGQRVLEIGAWKGRSTVVMAEAASHVVTIDWFRGDGFTGPAFTLPEFIRNLDSFGVRDKVTVICDDFRRAMTLLNGGFGLVFYDADHTGEATSEGLDLIGRVASNAVVAVHDYAASYPQVMAAVDRWAAEFRRDVAVVGTLAVSLRGDL